MVNTSLDDWAYSFTEEVFNYWQENYPEYDRGVKTFHSPVKKTPEFLILSYNPGWTEGDGEEDLERYRNKEFSPPAEHEFIERDYEMAKKARKLFKNNLDTLENSVMHDLIFFRSNDVSELKQKMRDEDGFEDLKSFSLGKVKNSIETLKPEKILLLGIGTFKLFNEEIDEIQVEREVKKSEIEDKEISKYSDRRVFIEGELGETKVYAIAHLSNARGFSNKELEFDRKNLFG